MVSLIPAPLVKSTLERVVDRRDGTSWDVKVERFLVGATVVTVGEWREVMSATGSADGAACLVGRRRELGEDDRRENNPHLPRVDVSWREAVVFCNVLSQQEGLAPVYEIEERAVPEPRAAGWRAHSVPADDPWRITRNHASNGYRLPTEAEWQISARAGMTGPRHGELEDIAWYDGNAEGRLHPVAQKRPNPWGLYDMLGGVWEWCWDLYDEEVYGSYRIIRGGGWSDPRWSCRVGVRRKTNPDARFDDLGFRVVRSVL